MASLTHDDRSLLTDGKRVWLVSGSLDYFRTPAALWRDRLLKARRGGLNCISTALAWNIHEQREGQWDFTGDRDVAGFIRLAGELGLYVILRAGPYVGSELDFGGLPGWLTAKAGLTVRANNAAFLHYFDRYFRQILPRLADMQVSHGGNIVLVQNENEYAMTTMPDRLAYLEFISQLFRRSGFDIPITNCNLLSDPPLPESMECVNAGTDAIRRLKQLRLRQPGAPLMVSQFRFGQADVWGEEHAPANPRQTARQAMEILACGSQFNYHPWHGGTNFAFWAGRLARNEAAYVTTSHDGNAPLAEGGGLTDTYYLCRLVNMLALHMGQYLAACGPATPGVSVHDGTQAFHLTSPNGQWAFVTNGGQDAITSSRVSLPDGRELELPLQPLGASGVAFDLRLNEEYTLDFTTLMPLGFFFGKVLVLHGPSGWTGQFSVNGQARSVTVPADDTPICIDLKGMKVLVLRSELAQRTWWVDDTLVMGPAYVGETLDQIVPDAANGDWTLLGEDGKLVRKKAHRASPAAGTKAAKPSLSPWKLMDVCQEPFPKSDLQWKPIDRPRDMDSLGTHYGYLWYRAQVNSSRAMVRKLFLPFIADRADVFLNGNFLGVWGDGPGATRKPLTASFKKGDNTLVLLVDNMGRFEDGEILGEPKGLWGHVYDAKPLKTSPLKIQPINTFQRRIVPRLMQHLLSQLEQMPVHQMRCEIDLTTVAPVHLSFRQVPHPVAILCNDRPVGMFPCHGQGFGDVTLSNELKKGKNRLEFILWGNVSPAMAKQFQFHLLGEAVTQDAAWSIRTWQSPSALMHHETRHHHAPAWYSASFKHPDSDMPLFLHMTAKGKGQLFLNGHNLGRFWSVGPQEMFYLPSCWFQERNELLLFGEATLTIGKASLEFRPAGPYR